MKKLYPIKKFKEGLKIQGFYICTEKSLRYTRNGDLYIDIEIRDRTGHISAKIWDKVDQLNTQFEAGDAVAISGEINMFLDQLQLVVEKIKKATKKKIQHDDTCGSCLRKAGGHRASRIELTSAPCDCLFLEGVPWGPGGHWGPQARASELRHSLH